MTLIIRTTIILFLIIIIIMIIIISIALDLTPAVIPRALAVRIVGDFRLVAVNTAINASTFIERNRVE